jgi:type I restriction enzyme S subunit
MVSNSWRDTTLGEFVRLQRGHDLPEADRQPGVVPIMGSAGLNGFHNAARARGPGVVIGRSGVGSMGVVSYCATDYWPHNTVLYVTDFLGNDERFTYYLLRHLNLRRFDSGSAQASLNRNYIYPIQIRVPKPDEQRAIAHILGTLDDKIEVNRRMNETLEAIARAIFKSWFVDFDPVRAKVEGRDSCLPKHIADLFPYRFEDSELGEIPVGWAVRPFADTVEIIGGGTPKTSVAYYWNGDIPWFSVGDAPRDADVWVVDTEKKVTWSGIENSSTRVLPEGTTIISARGTVGRVALIGVPMAMNQSCYGLRGRSEKQGFYTYFTTRGLIAELQQRTHGSVFDTITRDTLKGVPLSLAPASVILAFEKRVTPLLERIRANIFESRTLATLRDALLSKLLLGEVRIHKFDCFKPSENMPNA